MTTYKTKYSADKFWLDILDKINPNPEPPVSLLNLLIIHAAAIPAWNDDVVEKLTPYFDTIDSVNGGSTTPSLETMEEYDCILAYTDSSYVNATNMGNNLKDYVDGGGGVVTAVFAGNVNQITGTWASSNYNPITSVGQSAGSVLTLGVIAEPEHPIMDEISSFSGGASSFHNTGSVNVDSTLIASWSNAVPLVIEKNGLVGKSVFLNFFPPSEDAAMGFWLVNTDGARLMANALNYVGGA